MAMGSVSGSDHTVKWVYLGIGVEQIVVGRAQDLLDVDVHTTIVSPVVSQGNDEANVSSFCSSNYLVCMTERKRKRVRLYFVIRKRSELPKLPRPLAPVLIVGVAPFQL
jgi:hypothetical protein